MAKKRLQDALLALRDVSQEPAERDGLGDRGQVDVDDGGHRLNVNGVLEVGRYPGPFPLDIKYKTAKEFTRSLEGFVVLAAAGDILLFFGEERTLFGIFVSIASVTSTVAAKTEEGEVVDVRVVAGGRVEVDVIGEVAGPAQVRSGSLRGRRRG